MQVRERLRDKAGPATEVPTAASLFTEDQEERLNPHERLVFRLLRPDESVQIDEIIEKLEPKVSSAQIFTVLFELELAGKIKQLPGKNFVRSF